MGERMFGANETLRAVRAILALEAAWDAYAASEDESTDWQNVLQAEVEVRIAVEALLTIGPFPR